MPAALSPRARQILEGLLAGKSLNELIPRNDPVRLEVERHLIGVLGQARPRVEREETPLERAPKPRGSGSARKKRPPADSQRALEPRARSQRVLEPTPQAAPHHAVAYADGASRGNPGAAAIGIRVLSEGGVELVTEGRTIGTATNNVAEYRAAIAALEKALELGIRELELRIDSQLVARQLEGTYRVKEPTLSRLKDQIDALRGGFRSLRVKHVPREENAEADRLANAALDGRA
jgi:ribonuclease HI/probable phosphoglycerate mutase